jgi:mycothiol synthase
VALDPDDPSLRPAPPGFTLRRPTWDDLDAVAALFVASSIGRRRDRSDRRNEVRFRWLELGDLDDVLLVERRDGEPVLAGYAAFQVDVDPWTEELDLHAEARVHPDWTGRGLGGFLLARSEDRASRAARAAGRGAVVLRTTVVDGDDRARAFLTERGFAPIRHLLELRLDLHAAPPAPSWPSGVTCRSFVPGRDEALAWRTHQLAFADVPTHLPLDLEAWLEDRIERDPRFDPGLLLLAEAAGEPVGIAVCRSGTEVTTRDGWVRDLGVVPAWRRRGLGMALLRTAFAGFRDRGLTGVALEVDDVTVDGAVELYRRAGMRIVHRTDILERTLRLDVAAG